MLRNAAVIKKYWNNRAVNAQLNPNATTNDVYLRELETKTFVDIIKKNKKKKLYILDLGCGDGFTTLRVAKKISDAKFLGIDYSNSMIDSANLRLNNETDYRLKKNVEFKVGNATKMRKLFKGKTFDIVLSSRCLINLPSSKIQFNVISQIASILKVGGIYIGIEAFEDGNLELNDLREKIGLQKISVRWHNLFFEPESYLKKTKDIFKSVEIINSFSAYYYTTRIIYSKYCQIKNTKPDYLHEIHKLAIDLPIMGNYSPIKLVIHKK